MFLLLDIGNSTTVMSSYDGTSVLSTTAMATDRFRREIGSLGLETSYSRAIVSSVVPEIDPLLGALDPVFISSENIPNLSIALSEQEEIGADRLVNALAAYHRVQGSCLIIDSGTALTFCYVDSKGSYQGGAIFPGMTIASKALHEHTAKIPLVWVEKQDALCGKTTEEAVKIGLYHGYQQLINGMITAYRAMDPSLQVIGTGAGLQVVQDALALDAFVPDLIVEGLALCSDYLVAEFK